jgi:hypothetical protein
MTLVTYQQHELIHASLGFNIVQERLLLQLETGNGLVFVCSEQRNVPVRTRSFLR